MTGLRGFTREGAWLVCSDGAEDYLTLAHDKEEKMTTQPYEFAPVLTDLAASWELYESTCTNMGSAMEERRTQPCMRCQACDCIVYPPDQDGAVVHLISHHGWRMDGSQDPDHMGTKESA